MHFRIVSLVVLSLLCAVSCQIPTKQQTSSQANVDLLNMMMSQQRKQAPSVPQKPVFVPRPTYRPVQRPRYSPLASLLAGAYMFDNMDFGMDFNLFE